MRVQIARVSRDVGWRSDMDKYSGIFMSLHIGCVPEIYFVS